MDVLENGSTYLATSDRCRFTDHPRLPVNEFRLAKTMPRNLIIAVKCAELSNTAISTRAQEGYINPNSEDLTELRLPVTIDIAASKLMTKLKRCTDVHRNARGLWGRDWMLAYLNATEVLPDGRLNYSHPLWAHRNNLLYFSRDEWRRLCYSWNGRQPQAGRREKAELEADPMPVAYRQVLHVSKTESETSAGQRPSAVRHLQ